MFIHIDIDSFFVSAERSANSSLKGKPVAVGGRSNLEIFSRKRNHIRLMDDNSGAFVAPVFYSDYDKSFKEKFIDIVDGREKIRGIVTTSSYEARAFGVKTAMPIAQALQLCPQMIVVPSHYLLYHKLSHTIHAFISSQIPSVEQFSIDEFFGDLSGWVGDAEAVEFSKKLQEEINSQFDIPVSIGLASSKWIAKLATEFAKPYGVYKVEDTKLFINDIPISKFPGIGRRLQEKLHSRGIKKLGEIEKHRQLFESWGKSGKQLFHRILGSSTEGINPKESRKSVGISRTFDPIDDPDEIRRRVMVMARHICYIVIGLEANPTLYYLKINYQYGVKVKLSQRTDRIFSEKLYKEILAEMFSTVARTDLATIKLTLNVSDFTTQHPRTLSLLDLDNDLEAHKLSEKIHELRGKFGLDVIRTANEL
ncbi:MAG: DNA polymerase IV [Sulfurovum sp.]|nr:DNA polymerase IV [Sulfurovum sp.]